MNYFKCKKITHQQLLDWLKKEVKLSLGCTEPIAIAYAAAVAAKYLNAPILKITGNISENLYKNAMGVTIPGTSYCGVTLAAAIGAIGGNADADLEVLKDITATQITEAYIFNESGNVCLNAVDATDFIFIDITLYSLSDQCRVVIQGSHTNVTEVYINNIKQILVRDLIAANDSGVLPEFSLNDAFKFVTDVAAKDIMFMLKSAEINTALSDEGQRKNYGLNVSGALSQARKNGFISTDLLSQMLINTTAASDARMGGAPLPAMSNYGSGNQGITVTMPVVTLARHLNTDDETLARALALAHLAAISIHMRYTRLSALCAASTAAMGAAAGMSWLLTQDFQTISYAVSNMISDISGIICDGASNSCAMKVSTATACAFKSVLMAQQNSVAGERDGIVSCDVEGSINNLCKLVLSPMRQTDKEIISIMTRK
ncbi:serine dehydratase subunit alpha family protein (plasmid) [Klebsiella pneumoniae]|nr:L-serine ammonia-lyase, iron-sulfur-dependent, subunit alpha [Klebsiella pneumoniae]QLT97150.1 serine dehydratase subunit alpha family protein [Klebsiella pneumoniae]HCB9078189.1 serine dehydratase subunit alpha family protein [Klebsiella pneumoniae]HDK6300740.1 serine dehydratase subunit alpha family protein [Klebsiella pneumoniae]HDK6702411.1 serine dehydratase subunit alpha family protein [Klebsiella pneumoniae]HDK6876478.1 serine dehydratase subunit alpha family protein [Klebsiella pneu